MIDNPTPQQRMEEMDQLYMADLFHEDWWDEYGDDYDDYSSPYDIDPTPQYLYDDTGGEPPISAEERTRKAFEQKLRDKG